MSDGKTRTSETEVAKRMGMTVTELRTKTAEELRSVRSDLYNQVRKLKEEGLSNVEISKVMGLAESTVRQIYIKPKK